MRLRAESLATALILLAFAGLMIWLLQRSADQQEEILPPLTTYSPQPDGSMALYELLQRSGLAPRRYHGNEYHYPSGDCMVIMGSGQPDFDAILSGGMDSAALRLWIEAGGRLVLIEEPGLPMNRAGGLLEELGPRIESGSELPENLRAFKDSDGKEGRMAAFSRMQSNGTIYKLDEDRPELWTSVERIETGHDAGFGMESEMDVLLATSNSAGPQSASQPAPATLEPLVLHRKHGAGELIWVTRPEVCANDWLPRADNHRLLLALIDYAADGRQLWFDEHIHGYRSAAPNVLAVLLHTSGGRMLLGLAALGLLLFAGGAVRPSRFHPEPAPQRRQSAEMVLAQASLYRRAGARHVIAESQVDGLRRAYMNALHLPHPPGDRVLLDWLAALDFAGKPLLEDYLRDRLLPRSGSSLLRLTQACDIARGQLRMGRRG